MERLEEVDHPRPLEGFLLEAFEAFRKVHPWVGAEAVRPKSIGREMVEGWLGFNDYVRRYGLERAEGVLLRYLSRLYKVLEHSVPRWARTEGLYDAMGYLRAVIARTDTSLIEEWESLLHPELGLVRPEDRHAHHRQKEWDDFLSDLKALESRLRAEMHVLVAALAEGAWEDAAEAVLQPEDDPWPPERFERAMAPFLERYGSLVWNHEARLADRTRIVQTGPGRYRVTQTLLDPEGDELWYVEAEADLSSPERLDAPLLRLVHLGE